jgi:2-C-methyl-D-erythritol 4-phosphate cytidylyltransferase
VRTSGVPNQNAPGAALVLLAAGSGTRAGHATNKVFLPLAGRRVFTWSLDWTSSMTQITRTLLVVRDDERSIAHENLARESPDRDVELVSGGASRHQSEYNALRALEPSISRGEIDLVVIHDAARPLVGTALFAEVIEAAREAGGAIPGRCIESLHPLPGGESDAVRTLVSVQTPQAFRAIDLLKAYDAAEGAGFEGTDTSSCVERYSGLEVRWISAAATNIKITFAEDLFVAHRILERTHWTMTRDGDSPRHDRGSSG